VGDRAAGGTARVFGEPLPDNAGIDQTPPKNETGPRHRAPANKTLLLVSNRLPAKRGVRAARRAA
jgi:hypothetical protein